MFSLFLLLLTKAGRTGETTHLLGRKVKKLFQKLKNAKYPLDTQYYVLYSITRKGAFHMLDPQMKRGLLEACVLSALARGDSYGYKIVKDLSVCVQVSESTLYPILRRLENAGALTVYSVEHNSRLRKFYHLTEQGRQQLSDAVEDWKELESMYEFIRGGLRNDQG